MPRTSNQTVCSAGHRPMRTRPPVASCCGARRRTLPISLRVVWCPPLPPAMMYRSRRERRRRRERQSRAKMASTTGAEAPMGTTMRFRAQKYSPLMCRRDLPHFHARHRPFHQTQGRWAPTQIEGPLFELGKLGPGCNDRGEQGGRTRARPRSILGKMALHPLPVRFTCSCLRIAA